MASDILLNFYNYSNATDNPEVIIFQKNVAENYDELAVAWKVIQNCGQGDYHPFTYPMTMYVSAGDSYDNYTPKLKAENGQSFSMQLNPSGDQLVLSGESASSPNEVEVWNNLKKGAISANVYKNGSLLALKTGVAPGQKAVFEFKPYIWIGVASQIVEGQVMNSAVLSQFNTQLSLQGIASADIYMTGGGPGPNSTPYQFTLQNVVLA